MGYALDKARQAFGEYKAKADHLKGCFSNPFEKEHQPMEFIGYEIEKERIEMLENLLSEQAGSMGL